jgi:hypothetical protein
MRLNRMITVTITAACAVGLALTGCSSSGSKSTPSPAPKSSAAATSKAAAAPALKPAAKIPAASGNKPKLIKQVAQKTCAATAGGWQVTGSVHNTGASDRTYTILTYFTTSHATVIDSATAKVDAKAGQTAAWKAAAKFKTEPGMRCVVVKVT